MEFRLFCAICLGLSLVVLSQVAGLSENINFLHSPILASSLIQIIFASGVFGIGALLQSRAPLGWVLAVVVLFSIVGTSIGVLGGLSREGVVGDLVPAMLAIVGAAVVYLYKVDERQAVLAFFAAAVLTLSMLASYTWSSSLRGQIERTDAFRRDCVEIYMTPEFSEWPAGDSWLAGDDGLWNRCMLALGATPSG